MIELTHPIQLLKNNLENREKAITKIHWSEEIEQLKLAIRILSANKEDLAYLRLIYEIENKVKGS